MLLLFEFCDRRSDKLEDISGDRECLRCIRICPGILLYIPEFILHVLIAASELRGHFFPSAGERKRRGRRWVGSQQ